MINEEITQKDINLAVRVSSIAAAELKKALEKVLAQLQQGKGKTPEQSKSTADPELKRGKQTLKQLHKHNDGLSSIELKDPELRRLYREMKKNDIDFSCVKDGKGKYTLFFKGKNADEMTHAFKRYTEKTVARADKKAIKTELREAKAAAKALETGRDKVKNRSKGARDI
jgi:hypothetical protein